MSSFLLGLHEIDKTKIMLVGGKGANLGELSSIEGIDVPEGFCISTEAFKRVIGATPAINQRLDQLSLLKVTERVKIAELSREIRRIIEEINIPQDISTELTLFLSRFDEKTAYAIRSSATAEDLPTASFAGQQDTYLNIIGKAAILEHISKCWASLFTERAIIYRLQNGFDHRKVYLAVVVQKMVLPQAAGVLFTADPLTANRKVLTIDASFGLGEALVSGVVNADLYKVRNGKIIDKQIATKRMAIYALKDGGTKAEEVEAERQHQPALSDAQILQLERIGREIEAHFAAPQDIEWALLDDRFYIVQSRPITTLFPIPEVNDQENHLYISVGHQQMMTDAMKPLGISVRQLTSTGVMYTAGGRMFVDVAKMLATSAGRETMLNVLGKSDPLIRHALTTMLERGDFIPLLPDEQKGNQSPPPSRYQTLNDYDAAVVTELIKRGERELAALKEQIETRSGVDLIDLILEDLQQLKKNISDPQSFGVIMTGMNALSWLNEKMQQWLGEKNAADTLTQSVSHNITSEMGLALLDVADAMRPYAAVIDYLQHVKEHNFLDELAKLNGGQEARNAIRAFLNKYGMRCVGEIDITKPRWSERPVTLVPIILTNIKNFEPGESKRRFEQGLQEALKKEPELLARLKQLPDGEEKVSETKRMIDLVRNLIGYREYPKYHIVSRYFVYKQALLKEAEQLVQTGVICEKEDIYYLTLEELREVVRTKSVDDQLINKRKEQFKSYERLTPPRVMTSDGEIITGEYKREDLPMGAIVGLAVSAGVIEGRARVILNMEDADLEDGDILVTAFTDPSWTPLFVAIKGLVTEVGGLMTHGAVIAREYGLPAVVGVDNATKLIKDGQQIRVHGTEGYIEIL